MIITKYRMITENGYIETLNEQEAIEWGNYTTVTLSGTEESHYLKLTNFGFDLPEFIEEGEGKVVNNEKSIRELGIRYGDLSVSLYL